MANARSITSFTSGDHVRSLVRRRDRVYDRVGNHQLIEALESVVRSLRSSRSITAAIVESTTRHPTDLTRALDRNQLPVMGKVWGPEAIAKNQSTAHYGNLSVIVESSKKDGYDSRSKRSVRV